MAAFARQIPGLGGYHFEAGELVVGLTEAGRPEAARAALARVAARGDGRIRVWPARYTFLQLQAWRDAWSDRLLDVSGVAFVDLDEAANRITVGVAEAAARMRVLEMLRSSEVPVAALGFVAGAAVQATSEPIHAPYLNTWPTQGDSITSFRRPLEGGVMITYRRAGANPDEAIRCSLGFIAVLNGVRVAVTSAHCSQRHWDLDNTSYFQSTPGAGRNIGYEYRDPNGSNCGALWMYVCRHSDASAIAVEPGVSTNLGSIVRPVGPPPIGRNPYLLLRSSFVVDASNPSFRITGRGAPYGGEYVDKVGGTTGWTRGPVYRTCVDMPADRSWSKLRCQYWVSLSSAGGDSGGPVFIAHQDSTATLLGLLWGLVSEGGQQYATFSLLSRIETDLGSLQVMPGTTSGGGGDPGGGGSVPGGGSGPGGGGCSPDCIT